MGELRELVNLATVDRLFLALAVLGPLLGMGAGAWLGARQQKGRKGALRGASIGLFATLNWALWKVFNRLTDQNGLDSVANVFLNLALFVVVGVIAGLILARFARFGEPKA
jgi:lipopolysaccharide export LptBFGC system permease protein LptF